MVILHDGPDQQHQDIVQPYVDKYPHITYHQSKTRYNDYGHSLRQWALDDFVDTDWVLQTNDDNYYVPIFLNECDSIIKLKPDTEMVLLDCLMNTPIYNSTRYLPYSIQFTFPKKCYIDMGSFIVKSSIINTVGFTSRSFAADGILIDDIKTAYPNLNIIKINQTLCVHN